MVAGVGVSPRAGGGVVSQSAGLFVGKIIEESSGDRLRNLPRSSFARNFAVCLRIILISQTQHFKMKPLGRQQRGGLRNQV
jgi:hypothetical protein